MNQRCYRCAGRKKVFKIGNIYSLTDIGGTLIECNLCLGKGEIDLEEELKIEEKKQKNKKELKLEINENVINNKSTSEVV